MKTIINKDLVHENLVQIINALDFDVKDMYTGKSDVFMRVPGYDYDIIIKAYLTKQSLSLCIKPKYNYNIDIDDVANEFTNVGFNFEQARKSKRIIIFKEWDVENPATTELIDWLKNKLEITIKILNTHYE